MAQEHPHTHLRFFADGEWEHDAELRARDALEQMVSSREWLLGPPVFDLANGELAGELTLHSALPPWGDRLSIETDSAELDQMRALLETLSKVSMELATNIAIEMDVSPGPP